MRDPMTACSHDAAASHDGVEGDADRTSREHHAETRLCRLAIVDGGRTSAIVSLADIAARPRASTQNEGDED